jgi:hypothetical protein
MAQRIEEDDEELFGHLRDNEKLKARKVFIVKLTAIHDAWRLKRAKGKAMDQAKNKNLDQNEHSKTQKLEDKFVSKKGGQSELIVKELIKKQADKSLDENEDEEEELQGQVLVSNADKADQYVEMFLKKFLIGSESTFLDNIDLLIMLKAMPTPITKFNRENCRLFNFNILQSAIIAYLNDDIVNAFDYFDLLNRDRVSGIRDLILYQKNNLNKVLEIMQAVKENVQENEEVYKEYHAASALLKDD